jgi:2,3-bisphosphoglycerate-independent phosphoglycerate mutase
VPRPKPLILTILDGWGFSPSIDGNAIAAARKPTYDRLLRDFPNTLIQTSGPAVGLPEGQMGNSEVGHLNIGAGRVLLMEVMRIDLLIEKGEFFRNPVLLDSMRHARTRRLHLMGLTSQGGVHAQLTHLYALLKLAKQEGVTDVCVHCFTDGRDTPPNSGIGYLQELQSAWVALPRSPAAITPWIGTSGGSESSGPSAQWYSGMGTGPPIRSRRCAGLMTRAVPTSSWNR